MIYTNKLYSISDIAKKLKIKEKDIHSLIDRKIIPASNSFGVRFLRGNIVQNLKKEISKFNKKPEIEGTISIGEYK